MLERILKGVPLYPDPEVLVGYGQADDGGVYRLDEETALVQTIDFFTPVVDDPFLYGQIAAANSLSDIYAMGGVPRVALSMVGFPVDKLSEEVLHRIILGGSEKMKEAEVAIIGGHSVQDQELKFGYAVTGLVDPKKVYTNGGARPNDALLITKPLGTGIVSTGIKFQKTPLYLAEEAIQWMCQLNGPVRDQLENFSVHSVTDVTGNGLVGHAYEMALSSAVTVEIDAKRTPVMEGVEELARKGLLPGAIKANRRYVGAKVRWHGVSKVRQQVLLDPQTSGGLLVSLASDEVPRFTATLNGKGCMARQIGRVREQGEFLVEVQ